LRNRRPHELLDFEHGGFKFTGGIGRFEDGRLPEVFLNGAKIGTPIDVNARDAANHGEPGANGTARTDAGGRLAAVLNLVEGAQT
jgi:hypothetical protein